MRVVNCFKDVVDEINASGKGPMIDIRGPYKFGESSLYLMRNHLMPDSAIVLRDIFKVFSDNSSGIALKKYVGGHAVGISNIFPVLELLEQVKFSMVDKQSLKENFQFIQWCKDVGINCLYVNGDASLKKGYIWNGDANNEIWIYDLSQSKDDPRLREILDFVHVV